MLSRGQSRRLKISVLAIAVFLISTYLIITYFSNLFTDSNIDTNFTIFDMLKVIAPYTASFSFGLYAILAFIFGKESNKVLPKGFYTTTSWLDIVHDTLVVIKNNELVFFEINENQKHTVQSAYQDGTDKDSLIQLADTDKIIKIPFNDITNIYSEHNEYFISINHGEDNHTINFMTPLVKSHFLISLRQYLSSSLEYNKKKKTRLEAMVPTTAILLILAGIGFYFGNVIVSLLLGAFGLLVIFPLLFKVLIDPPIVETWETPATQDSGKEKLSPTT